MRFLLASLLLGCGTRPYLQLEGPEASIDVCESFGTTLFENEPEQRAELEGNEPDTWLGDWAGVLGNERSIEFTLTANGEPVWVDRFFDNEPCVPLYERPVRIEFTQPAEVVLDAQLRAEVPDRAHIFIADATTLFEVTFGEDATRGSWSDTQGTADFSVSRQ